MAVVREFIASNGAHVQILDDAYAHLSEEEQEQRREAFRQTVIQVWRNNERRRREEMEKAALTSH